MALLPPLEWRKLPVRIITTASLSTSDALNIVYDMLTGSVYYDGTTRTIGSGSAWSASGKFVTGSATEAFWCYPPVLTSISQSIIFAGKSASPLSSSAATPYVLAGAYERALITTSRGIFMALVKNASASFTQWTSIYPFGSGSLSSGYIRASQWLDNPLVGSKFVIYESKEALSFMHYLPVVPVLAATIAGAIIDPEQTDSSSAASEEDGRIYAIAGTSAPSATGTSLSGDTNWLTSTAAVDPTFLGFHQSNSSTTTPLPKFVYFTPNTSNQLSIISNPASVEKINNGSRMIVQTQGGRTVSLPLKCFIPNPAGTTTTAGVYLGRLRDINMTKRAPFGTILFDTNGIVVGYILSANETSVNDAVVFNHY
jgi:hypothetical protein